MPVPAWLTIQQQITAHADISTPAADVVYTVQGKAGVGKTRLVYESLRAQTGLENLILYASDEKDAEAVAYELANDNSACAILVADDCSIRTRLQLRELLGGLVDRVRVIAIDNHARQPSDAAQAPWLERLPEADAERILGENYLAVPVDRRREYARLAKGFIRFAADMCDRDAQIVAAGSIGLALGTAEDYYHNRLQEDARYVAALSVVKQVGFRDDVAEELTALSALIGIPREQLVQRALALKDSPGFIVQGGRYFYVTPDVVAQIAFADAWRDWIAPDPAAFLARIPKELIQPFLERVAESSGSEEVRRIVGDFFRHEVHRLSAADLLEAEKVDRLVKLVETDPAAFLPEVRRLIESSPREQLLAITGIYRGRWGPRRALVWLSEKLAGFQEYFRDAEAVLWRLAQAESEPGIGNNATGIWQGLFSATMSATAVPFDQRIKLLEHRLLEAAAETSGLDDGVEVALGALKYVFSRHGLRSVGPATVGGRLAPAPWWPSTAEELRHCQDAAVQVLARTGQNAEPRLGRGAREISLECLGSLIELGYLSELRTLLSPRQISDDIRARLISAVGSFLDHAERRGIAEAKSLDGVRSWLKELQPDDLHGRVLSATGKDPWRLHGPRHTGVASPWKAELEALGRELAVNATALAAELPWLNSDQARAAGLLGEVVGRHDPTAACLVEVFAAAAKTESTGFARGYVQGLLGAHANCSGVIGQALDQMEQTLPRSRGRSRVGVPE